VLIAAIVAGFLYATFAGAAPIEPGDVRVFDGDTIRVFHKKPNARLEHLHADRR